KGICQENPDSTYEVILSETDATNQALNQAQNNDLVVIFPEKVDQAIGLIKQRIKTEQLN
ncbi:MAG: hypothetical protein WBM44_02110, partial [Waterburya sp.]